MKRIVRLMGIVLGILGFALCIAALVGVWVAFPNWVHTTNEVSVEIDQDLALVNDRIEIARQRVRMVSELTVTFRTNLKAWATAENQDPEHAGQRAELISARLHQIRDGLDFAESFLKRMQTAQKLAHPFQAHYDNSPIAGLLEQLAVLKDRVSRLVDSVDEIRRKFAGAGNEAQLEQTIEQATAELVRILEVIDSLDDRIGQLSKRVSEAQSQAKELEEDILHGLWWGRLGASFLLPWMAAGQIALVVLCWRRSQASFS